MPLKPTCPECGSIKVAVGKKGTCLESDCGHVGSAGSFRKVRGSSRSPNMRWRDPVAMLPGRYDDNA